MIFILSPSRPTLICVFYCCYSWMNVPHKWTSPIKCCAFRLEFADLMEKFRDKDKQTNQSIHPYNQSLYPCDGMLFPMVSLVHQKKSSMANTKLSNINYQLLMIWIKKKSTKPMNNDNKNSWKIVNSVISFGSRNLNYIQYSVVYTHTHSQIAQNCWVKLFIHLFEICDHWFPFCCGRCY